MHPDLVEAPWGVVHGYGTAIVLGIALTVPLARWDARARGLDWRFVLDFYIALIAGGVVGGRLAYVGTQFDGFRADPHAIFALRDGGFVFLGSLAGAVVALVFVARRYDTRFMGVLDLLLTWMPLAHVFGRLGCFLAGCCWGAPARGVARNWAVRFPESSVAWRETVGDSSRGSLTEPLHPVQLYEAVGLAAIFVALALLRLRRGVEPGGKQVARYLIAYALLRLITEAFRGDLERGHALVVTVPALAAALGLPADQPLLLSTSQAICLLLVAAGGWFAWALDHRRRRN